MPTKREVDVFQFDELDDRAKEKAREWYRRASADDSFWSEHILEEAPEILARLGFALDTRRGRTDATIYYSGFSSQGDGACFEGSWDPSGLMEREAFRKEYPASWTDAEGTEHRCDGNAELQRIADESHRLAALDPTQGISWRVRHTGHYSHEHSVTFEHFDERDPEALPIGDIEADHEANARDAMRWIYRQLEHEWEYQNSDECVDENIRANEYEFDQDGERMRFRASKSN